MDSAPSSSVVGIQTGSGTGSGAHGHQSNSSGIQKKSNYLYTPITTYFYI